MNKFYKDMRSQKDDMVNNGLQIFDSAQVIFAEELINYMMFKYHGTPYFARIANAYCNRVPSHFSSAVENAVKLMESLLSVEFRRIIKTMKSYRHLNRKMFMGYAQDIYDGYLAAGLEYKKFLYFCVHVTRLAMDFVLEGVPEAPEFALYAILYCQHSQDLDRGGWDTLKISAEDYVATTDVTDHINCAYSVFGSLPTLNRKGSSTSESSDSEGSDSKDEDQSSTDDTSDEDRCSKRRRLSSFGGPSSVSSIGEDMEASKSVKAKLKTPPSPEAAKEHSPSKWGWSTDESPPDMVVS